MLQPIVPELIILSTALIILMLDLFIKEKNFLGYLSLFGVIITLLFALSPTTQYGTFFSSMLVIDRFVVFFDLLFLLAASITILLSLHYLTIEENVHGEYYSLLLLATLGMMLMVKASDLIIVFLGIETLSLAIYVLAGYLRTEVKSNESAMKYFLLGAFSTAFLLYGIALIYGATGSTNLATIASYIRETNLLQNPLLLVSMGLILIGFGFKVSMVPFHMWTPDVYEGAPTSITAFMAVGVKAAAFSSFLRVFLSAFPELRPTWVELLWILSVLTMTVGNIIAITQDNIKRMLAYSSIAHAGYLLVGMIAGGELGISGMLYYLLAYTFMNLGAFGVVIAYGTKTEENVLIKDYAGLGFKYPLLGFCMSVFMFSLAGIPPLSGFVGKFYIFSSAIKEGYIWLTIIGVMNSLISVYYYLRITVFMYMREPEKEVRLSLANPALVAALVVTTFFTVQMGVFPAAYLELARMSIQMLR
jgi:NADH-quinone oxidoreductase subunit N